MCEETTPGQGKNHPTDGHTGLGNAGLAKLTSDKDFRTETITRDKEDQFLMINGSIHKEDTTILNMYVPNNNFKIYESKSGKLARKNRQIHNSSWRFKYPPLDSS